MRLLRRMSIAVVALPLFLGAAGTLSSASYGSGPSIELPKPEDFACVSGVVTEAPGGEPVSGVGVCVFPQGVGADSSQSAGIVYEAGLEYPLPAMPRQRWKAWTDSKGRFAICQIPSWLAERSFAVVIYKPGYVPEVSVQITAGGSVPSYELSLSLIKSGQ